MKCPTCELVAVQGTSKRLKLKLHPFNRKLLKLKAKVCCESRFCLVLEGVKHLLLLRPLQPL